jgi:hypothetical protein
VIGTLAAIASLFLVEAMNHTPGNDKFQLQVEFATIAELCLGPRSHIILQIILFLALQSVNISSIIISCQVNQSLTNKFADSQSMDVTLIQLFHKTCALSFTQGWVCGMSNL